MRISKESYCEDVSTIAIEGTELVLTEGEYVAKRVQNDKAGEIDALNPRYPKVKNIKLITEVGMFEVTKGKLIEGVQMTAFVSFEDGSFEYFHSPISGVRSVRIEEFEQIELF